MQYLLMIYRNEAEFGKMDAAARKKMMAEYGAFTQSIIQSGNFKAGDGLQPTTTATTVRVRDGKTLTTDGPFAETREQLGGYYLVEAKDLDTALAIAARIPGARTRFDRGQADHGFIIDGAAVIPGRRRSVEPGISRFRVSCFAPPRNDESQIATR